jgi:hypothetical protein
LYLFFYARLLYMFRVLSAPIIRSTIKTADAVLMIASAVLIVLLMMGSEST